jgi:hypothetical protein
MKRALLVSPSYAAHCLDPRTRYVLVQAAVLPPDLVGYRRHGFAKDAAEFKRQLGEGFEIKTLEGEVLGASMRGALEWLLEKPCAVAVLLFCGHGAWEGSSLHGSLVCSFNQRVSAEGIEAIASKCGFRGTFVRMLNMCRAEGQPVPASMGGPPLAGRALRDATESARTGTSPADYFGVIVAASESFGEVRGGVDGSEFMASLARMFRNEVAVTYRRMAELLKRYCPRATVNVTSGTQDGLFGGAAKPVSGQAPVDGDVWWWDGD